MQYGQREPDDERDAGCHQNRWPGFRANRIFRASGNCIIRDEQRPDENQRQEWDKLRFGPRHLHREFMNRTACKMDAYEWYADEYPDRSIVLDSED